MLGSADPVFGEAIPQQPGHAFAHAQAGDPVTESDNLADHLMTRCSRRERILDTGHAAPGVQVRTADAAGFDADNNFARPGDGLGHIHNGSLARSLQAQRAHAARVLLSALRSSRKKDSVKFVIFGLTISSAWANGHATPLRALLEGLRRQGHTASFFEHDVPYYARQRDLPDPDCCKLLLYSDWAGVQPTACAALADADVAIVTSYCPDGLAACRLVLDTPGPLHVFYDMDTPITLEALERDGLAISSGAHYLRPELIPEFDLYLSFTGGPVLETLKSRWGARRTAPLYGSVDPSVHAPVTQPPDEFRCELGYLGTYAADRQPMLERLLLEPARQRQNEEFLIAGSLYPSDLAWPRNVRRLEHLPPAQHPSFYSANRLTLSVSREAMREWGFTPSGRLFEATSCGAALITDPFPGVDEFFTPGEEVLVAETSDQALDALELSDAEVVRIAAAGRERTLSAHTGEARARQLVQICELVAC
jgi:spore maturation protein CgeB